MKNFLSAGQSEILSRVVRSNTLLAFDFDGTLAPIVPARDQAALRAPTRALFTRVCELFPTAVISGRGRSDVAARLGGAKVKYVVGNHGIEANGPPRVAHGRGTPLAAARIRLGGLVAVTPGLELEEKQYSFTVHFRNARRQAAAERAILQTLEGLALRTIAGHHVINVVPEGAPDKGDALLALRKRAGAELALYVGDDVTDEDVFDLQMPRVIVSIRVGRSARSAAPYFLANQGEIDALLSRLIALKGVKR